jgi:hypothetical protein
MESAVMTAAILHLGIGRVLRVSSMAALRRLHYTPTASDVAIICPPSWISSRRLHRNLRRAGWSDVIIRPDDAMVADVLGSRVNPR